ncbi:DUF4381 domain-containing protein [Algoriphagus resistens]|uniref:DUF4381 domain-containing protein n=1 Tax=Algoriphagus resistens TaxID=1750590 RepID=UPI000716B19F|nr:DUF4381 domain-containing protein [Algoriphagus resistens]
MIQSDTIAVDSLMRQSTVPAPSDLGSIYEPPAVEFSFDTIGWTVLGGIVLVGLLLLIFFRIKKYLHNRYRREALAALQKIGSNEAGFSQVFVVLKRVAIHVFGREKVGPLHGDSWLRFLEDTGKQVRLLKYGEQVQALIYRDSLPDAQTRKEILSHAQKWIKTHAGKL